MNARAANQPVPPAPRADRAEMTEIVESILASLKGDVSAADMTIYQELEQLAKFIRDAKNEIQLLRPQDIREKYLPSATDELDAIVGATEQATHSILDAVESLEKLGPTLTGDATARINDVVTRIYEACNFQDITGQRINKVVKTMKAIEQKIDGLLSAFGDELARERAAAAAAAEAAKRPAREVDLLNGPQLPTEAVSQDDIDALFNKA
jgi:chemotaxis protein CheZ